MYTAEHARGLSSQAKDKFKVLCDAIIDHIRFYARCGLWRCYWEFVEHEEAYLKVLTGELKSLGFHVEPIWSDGSLAALFLKRFDSKIIGITISWEKP